jgi:hypothetical protein
MARQISVLAGATGKFFGISTLGKQFAFAHFIPSESADRVQLEIVTWGATPPTMPSTKALRQPEKPQSSQLTTSDSGLNPSVELAPPKADFATGEAEQGKYL